MNLETLITNESVREVSIRICRMKRMKSYKHFSKMAREYRFWSARRSLFKWSTGLEYQDVHDYAVNNPYRASIFADPAKKVRQLRKRTVDAKDSLEALKLMIVEEYSVFHMFPELSTELLDIPFSELTRMIRSYDKALLERVSVDVPAYEAEQQEIEIQRQAAIDEWHRLTSTAPVISRAKVCDFAKNARISRVVLSFSIPDEFGGAIASGLWSIFKGYALIEDRHEDGIFLVTFDTDHLPGLHAQAERLSDVVEKVYQLHPDYAGLISSSAAAKSLGISLPEVQSLIEAGELRPRKTIEIKKGRLAGKTFHGIAPKDLILLVSPETQESAC